MGNCQVFIEPQGILGKVTPRCSGGKKNFKVYQLGLPCVCLLNSSLVFFSLKWGKTAKFLLLRPAVVFFFLKSGPRTKKSGHPWYIILRSLCYRLTISMHETALIPSCLYYSETSYVKVKSVITNKCGQ